MVLLEAALELARTESAGPVIGLDATFDTFVEFDQECRLLIERSEFGMSVAYEQGGLLRGRTDLCIARKESATSGDARVPPCPHIVNTWVTPDITYAARSAVAT
ncbi:hypothetical protein DFJ65_0049 [Calidifontibacter indicus]|uniref:Uncharacterized protein n=2 Tax=Calidifontibacter indicus TaxID=419650 RepID=A0A3D9UWG5_9MICO|nr:hypothetical protein DFJ65_0049 [Calidifontibacter indicus]